MRSKHLPPNALEELKVLHNDFHLQYGVTLARWADLEQTLNSVFCNLCDFQEETGMGPALFFSGRSFPTRADLLSAAIRTAEIEEPTREVLRAVLKKARQFSTARNIIAHGVPVHFVAKDTEYQGWRIKEGELTWEPGGIGIDALKAAGSNFQMLNLIALRSTVLVRPTRRGKKMPPEAHLELLQLLPNDAFVPSDAPKIIALL